MSKLSMHQRKARDFIQREDWANALAELERVLEADGGNPTLHNQIGDVYLRKVDVPRACEHFEHAIELYAAVGLHNNAVALCKKVMRLRPARVEVRWRLAKLRLEQGFRTEAAGYFRDWLEQAPTDAELQETLESRCREVIDVLPNDAPVGKILERLEGAQRFDAALDIVRQLAQRAADTGDDQAARRYSEKMRSLRVLVERSGGRDLLADPAGPAAEPATVADMGTIPAPQAPAERLASPEPDTLPDTLLDPSTIDLPREASPAEPVEDWIPAPEPLAAPALNPDALAAPAEPFAAAPVASAPPDPDDPPPREYELSETSFDDLARELGEALVLPDAPPPTAQMAPAWNAAAPWREAPPAPEAASAVRPPDGGWVEELRRSPVWIPDGGVLASPDTVRADNGSTLELESVIDSFREQMARALDGDGAARYDLGVAYYEMGLYNEALAEFEAASRCPGFEVRSHEMLAACLLQTGRHSEVVELLVPMLAADGHAPRGTVGLHYALGIAYEALGDQGRARRCFEEVALVDVGFKDVAVRLQQI